jgi:hypothetical protein
MEHRGQALTAYSILGLAALAFFLGGIIGDTSDTGSGVGMAVFGGLFLSASVSGLLGVLAGSGAHVVWALAGFFLPGYSLPFVFYYGLKGWDERARPEERLEAAPAERLAAGASERALGEQRERAAPLAQLAERLRRLHAESSDPGGFSRSTRPPGRPPRRPPWRSRRRARRGKHCRRSSPTSPTWRTATLVGSGGLLASSFWSP